MRAKQYKWAAFFFCGLMLCSGGLWANPSLWVDRLQCEYREAPNAVDHAGPRLSWVIHSRKRAQVQSAWQVQVASTAAILLADAPDLWDSGKVIANQQLAIPYQGKSLQSLADCYWRVRVWNQEDSASAWSDPAHFRMGLLGTDDWEASWIQAQAPSAKIDLPLEHWVWHPDALRQAPSYICFDRMIEVTAPEMELILHLSADDRYSLFLNGEKQGENRRWEDAELWRLGAKQGLRVGANHLAVIAANTGSDTRGMIAGLALRQGESLTRLDGQAWSAVILAKEGAPPALTDSRGNRKPAVRIASYGDQPWGELQTDKSQIRAMPIFRRAFSMEKKPLRATAYICGLGQYELRVNGKKVGQAVMDPGWTNYAKTCLYASHDITSLLQQGENALGVMLGNGMYNVVGGRYTKFTGSFGPPKLICQLVLEYSDGTQEAIVSDESWRWTEGPIRFSCIFGGEDYDAREWESGWDQSGFDAAQWKAAQPCEGPGGVLRSQMAPPLRILQEFPPVSINEVDQGTFVYDFGQNLSGMPQLSVEGARGALVRLVPSEKLGAGGLVDPTSVGSPSYFDYTLAGEGHELWQPRFTYTGFRYLQVEGAVPEGAENPEGKPVVRTLKSRFLRHSAGRIGAFSASNPLFNEIYSLIDWAMMSNMQSVLTDCPHREKLGWLEETHLMVHPFLYDYAILPLLEKIGRDMREAQLDNGLVPDIAPEYVQFNGGFRDSAEWGSTCVLMPWYAYEWYGDTRILEENLSMMCRYVDYLVEGSKDYIAKGGLGDWYDFVPGESPGSSRLTPTEFTATAYLAYDAAIIAKIATLLEKPEIAARYSAIADQTKAAFNRKWFHEDTNQYARGSQTANAMALYMDLAPRDLREAVLANLVADVRTQWQTSGDVGHRYLIRALAQGNQDELIYDMTNRTDIPSYGGILKSGATSLTEAWDAQPRYSLNHFMLGHIQQWFQQELGGIAPQTPGFQRIKIRPRMVGDLSYIRSSTQSPRGLVLCHWKRSAQGFEIELTVPVNTEAWLYLPTGDLAQVTECGHPLVEVKGVVRTEAGDGESLVVVTSGTYYFTAK